MSSEITPEIDAADICERLVGITPVYLQNLLLLHTYGLRSSKRRGKVRKKRRLFSREDVYGIALVWELFESGLRGEPIERILNAVAGTKKADANKAAARLLEGKKDYILVLHTPRRPSKAKSKMPEQTVKPVTEAEFNRILNRGTLRGCQVIAIGEKFADVRKRLEILLDVR